MPLKNVDVINAKNPNKDRIDHKVIAALNKLVANSGSFWFQAVHDSDCPSFTLTHYPGHADGDAPEVEIDGDTISVMKDRPLIKARNFQRNTLPLAILAAAGMEPMKKCGGKCKKLLPVSSFSEHAGRKSGYASSCFACSKLRKPRENTSPVVQAATTRNRFQILRHRAKRKLPLNCE